MASKLGILVFAAQFLISRCAGLDNELVQRDTTNVTIAAPLVIPPSEYFEGNDGSWSTFAMRVGTPEQNVRGLVSTTSPETFVVSSQYGCSSGFFGSYAIPASCASSRGMLFNPNTSSTWDDQGAFEINGDGVGLEANLGYSTGADFGLETLGLGVTGVGPTLKNQTVAWVTYASPFYLGTLGLSPQPLNYSSLGNFSAPSFFQTLRSENKIPSLSWSYTAGAIYRLKKVYGQLIFGGYDTSRFTQNGASFTISGDITRDLVVYIQSISYSGSSESSLLTTPIQVFIDSTDPNIWLPKSVCKSFEDAFGLELDNKTGLYLINDTHHTALLAIDAQVTFRLSDLLQGGQAVNIVLPYSAFDLEAQTPLVNGTNNYFPLKQAANDTQYTLGRTFLQEAYLTVDYERGNFSVSQCTWVDGAVSVIVPILSKPAPAVTTGSASASSTAISTPSSGISGGAIAGVVIAIIAILALLAGALFWWLRRRRPQAGQAASPTAKGETALQPMAVVATGAQDLDHDKSDARTLEQLSQTHAELPPDSQIYQLNADGKLWDSHELSGSSITPEIEGRNVGPVYEMMGSEVIHEAPSEPVSRVPSPMSRGKTPLSGGLSPSSTGASPLSTSATLMKSGASSSSTVRTPVSRTVSPFESKNDVPS